jgi:uncharacterized protein YprB with RNaseH-like and TPR domain
MSKLLFLDIETAPIEAYTWGTFDQTISNNMIKKDWSILSWAAKWQGSKRVLQMDVEKMSEKDMLKGMWNLLDEAEVIVTQNGKRFDEKKLNARFIKYKMSPPSSFQHIDTYKLAKKHFAFTSNKLDYMTAYLDVEVKKSSHKKFPGFELWDECLKGNKSAWKEMRAYNKTDVLALEGLYDRLIVWEPNARTPDRCTCGSKDFVKKGFFMSASGVRYQRYKCKDCGAAARDRNKFKETA